MLKLLKIIGLLCCIAGFISQATQGQPPPTDTIWLAPDTVWLAPDTIWTPPDTVWVPSDTVYMQLPAVELQAPPVVMPPDTVWLYLPPDTIMLPPPDTVVTPPPSGECSSSLLDVSLPLCDGTYSQSITSSTFVSGQIIEAQHPGKVRFTGAFNSGSNLTFRGVVIDNGNNKTLGANSTYEDMSFIGGPACGNTVNTQVGSNVTIRRSAFYGPGGRYLLLSWQQQGLTVEDAIFRQDGGWGQGASCNGWEPTATLANYDSPDFECVGCIAFDGIITVTSESEPLGGLGVNGHNSTSNSLFENSLIVNNQAGGFWYDGNGTVGNARVVNSAAYGVVWGINRNVNGTTIATNFTTDAQCGNWKGSTQLVNSKIAGQSWCSGSTSGAGANIQLNTAFLNNPRWRTELCAGVSRGWCGTSQTLSQYLSGRMQ